ncbi:MAG: MBL fold metallo-hydrolase [Pirellulaceae bacterium]
MAQLTFHGAAETVTGSKYLLEVDSTRVMIDCGLFQGHKSLRLRNWDNLPLPASSIDRVLLTHAHLDHVGYLPRLVAQGYHHPVYCSAATRKLAEIILLDSAKNQKRDAAYFNRKGISKHKPALPLYDTHDARRAIRQLKAVPTDEWFCVHEPVWARMIDVGHLLGSCMIEIEIRNQDPPLRILFSGDVGRYDAPLYHDPSPPPPCDYLICESTYGNRLHPEGDLLDALQSEVNAAIERGGVILMASFAVGRSQQLIYLLQVLMHTGRIPKIPVYLDSPMSVAATEVFERFHLDHDLAEGDLGGEDIWDAGHIHMVKTTRESQKVNQVKGPAVIISSSGMMTGGRILFLLKRRLPDPKNTVFLGGYMVPGTRGRALKDGKSTIRIHGADIPVKAHIATIPGLSGHADQRQLLHWLEGMPPPRQVFLTHGEVDSAHALAKLLEERGFRTTIPKLGETIPLGT